MARLANQNGRAVRANQKGLSRVLTTGGIEDVPLCGTSGYGRGYGRNRFVHLRVELS